MNDQTKETTKQKAYSVLDFGVGAFVLGSFLFLVVVSYNGLYAAATKIFPSLKKEKA